METPPVSIALTGLGVPHRVFHHEKPVTSLEQAASDRGQRASQVVRSILFRVSEDEFLMVLAAGPAQVSWKALRKYVGKSRISMATEDEVLKVTGYRIGTVGPFGMVNPVRVVVEARLFDEEEVSIGSGMRNCAVILRTADLRRALNNPDVVSLVE